MTRLALFDLRTKRARLVESLLTSFMDMLERHVAQEGARIRMSVGFLRLRRRLNRTTLSEMTNKEL